MLFFRSLVYGFTKFWSLLEDPVTVMQGVFLWLRGLASGDEPGREPTPGVKEQPEPGLNSLALGSLSIPDRADGLCAQRGLMASALEGATCLRGPWGLLGMDLGVRPCDVGVDIKSWVPELPLLDMFGLRGGSTLVNPAMSGVLSLWGTSALERCWFLIGLGDLLWREGPLIRGLDGAVEENRTGEGLWLELSDSLQGAARLVVASFLTFRRNLGLSWDLRPPPVPLGATKTAVRGRGTGLRFVWAALIGTGGVLLPGLWPRLLLVFSKQTPPLTELFFPFSIFGVEGRWRGCTPDWDEEHNESWRVFAMLFASPLLGKYWWLPFRTLWGSAEGDRNTCAWAFRLNKESRHLKGQLEKHT